MSRYARVIVAYDSTHPDPISGERGDVFRLGRHGTRYPEFIWATAADGRGGWVPRPFLRLDGDLGRLIRDYTAEEITVDQGEVVEIQDVIGGWLWIATADGYQGWIPASSAAYGQTDTLPLLTTPQAQDPRSKVKEPATVKAPAPSNAIDSTDEISGSDKLPTLSGR